VRFFEINIFGVCVSPLSVMIVGAWLALLPLRFAAHRVGLMRPVWHPPLFWSAIYVVILSAIVMVAASWPRR
jgi:protein AaeX